MKLLLLSSHYPPDLSAGSFRASALVDALLRVGGEKIEIDVLTAHPHRYRSYNAVTTALGAQVERRGAVAVTRLPIRRHNNGLADRALAFPAFAARALREARRKRYDVVVATTSRLLTGYLGSVIARRMAVPYYLDVRDLFVHNLRGMLRSAPSVSALLPILSALERSTFQRATRVNLVSEGFLDYCRERYPRCEYSLYGNGIDREFLEYDFSKPAPESGPKIILYAGNIGLGQGLDRVVPEAARRLGPDFHFRIIGDGGRRAALEQALREARVDNVTVLGPVDREALKKEYRNADFLLLHLNDYPALECVVPSKLFEYAATGKPILAGVRGHPRHFISNEVDGAVTFEPADAADLADAARSLTPERHDRERFKVRFSRERLMDKMASDILEAASAARTGETPNPAESATVERW